MSDDIPVPGPAELAEGRLRQMQAMYEMSAKSKMRHKGAPVLIVKLYDHGLCPLDPDNISLGGPVQRLPAKCFGGGNTTKIDIQ